MHRWHKWADTELRRPPVIRLVGCERGEVQEGWRITNPACEEMKVQDAD